MPMHETALVRDLVAMIVKSAAGAEVTGVRLAVGPDCHADARTIEERFAIFASGSVAESATLTFAAPDPDDDPRAVRLLSIDVAGPLRASTESAREGEGAGADCSGARAGGSETDDSISDWRR